VELAREHRANVHKGSLPEQGAAQVLAEHISALFRTTPDTEYLMSDVTAASNVRMTTLDSCRERFRTDPQWRPSREHFPENRRVFSDDIELIFANFIRIDFLEPGRSLTRVILQPLILMLVQDLVAQRIFDDSFLNFKC
jgi:hypothetical protein